MNHEKQKILEGTDPACREGLKRVPGAYFQVASETVDDPTDREAVLDRLVQLYALSVEKVERRADAATAKLAELRRHGLHLAPAPDPPATSTIPKGA